MLAISIKYYGKGKTLASYLKEEYMLKNSYAIASIFATLLFISCTAKNTKKNQQISEYVSSINTFIEYNRNNIPVAQLLDSIDKENTLVKRLFLGERFFADSINNKLMAIHISYPISSLYLLDFNKKNSPTIFKEFTGYFKDGIFYGIHKYRNEFYNESFLIDYERKSGKLRVQHGTTSETYSLSSLYEFLNIFRKNISSIIFDMSDVSFKNIVDDHINNDYHRGLKINSKSLTTSEQYKVLPHDYYYDAILRSDGTIDNLQLRPPQDDNSRYHSSGIHNVLTFAIRKKKLKPSSIFKQPINTKIFLRVEVVNNGKN